MEIKNILNDVNILGIVSKYKSSIKLPEKVSDLKVKDIFASLKMVGLDDTYLDKKINELTISELWKIELLTKLDNEIIVVGNMYDSLIYKDREYMKKLFIKLSNNYRKKIVIIDNNVDSFINLVKKVVVIRDKNIVYETTDFYDLELYKYVNISKIVDFIIYVNSNGINLNKTLEIYELIKDIYREVS